MKSMKALNGAAVAIGLAASGFAQASAGEEDRTQSHGAHEQGGRSSQPAPRTGAGADVQNPPSQNQRQGWANLSPAEIEPLQRELASRGFYHGAVDGVVGPQTRAALRQFQQQRGLPSSGDLDVATRQALGLQLDRQPVGGAQTSSSPELERPVGRESKGPGVTGDTPMRSQVRLDILNQDQVRRLQTHLHEFGAYGGPVDGKLGPETRSALQRFFATQAELASRGMISDTTSMVFGLTPRELDPAAEAAGARGSSSVQPSGSPQGSAGSQGSAARGDGKQRNGATRPAPVEDPPLQNP